MGNAERPAHGPLRAHIIVRPLAMRPPRPRKLISLALGLGVVACLWFYLAPVALGGSTSYVVTDGVSMEPRFHTGDLVLVRSQSSYHVGEIVAYYSKAFHTVVLHRIVGRAGARYVFKGDNNDFVDFEHPASSQLIGALWVHLPGVGGTLESIRSPALIGGLAAIGTLLFAGGVFTQRRRRRRRRARAGAGAASAPGTPPQHSLQPQAGVLALAMLALAPFVLLALLAFTRPASRRVPVAVPYKQSGTLSYTAHSTPGPAYANNLAVTGNPLFAHVVHSAEMRFAYEFSSSAAHALAGEASLYAEITSTSGWKTTLELGRPTHFRGDRVLVAAPLDLTSLLALVRSVQLSTGVGGSYSLLILPRVSAGGRVSTVPVHASFSPQFHFTLTPLEVDPTVPAAGLAATGAQPPANPFEQSTSYSVTGKRSQPLALTFGVARLAVGTARALALAGIAVVVLALLAALAFLRPRARDEAETIRSRYGRLMVPVAGIAPLPGVAIIDVADMDSLVRIAEHYDRSILHESSAAGDAFWVTDESGQFRYALDSFNPAAEQGRAAGPAVAPRTAEFSAPGERLTDAVSAEAPGANVSAEALGANEAREPYTAVFAAPSQRPADAVYSPPPVLVGELCREEPITTELDALDERLAGPMYAEASGEHLADEAYAPTPYDLLTGPDYAAVPSDGLAEEVYADELELGALGYEPSSAGRRNRSNASPSLPAWTGSSG